MLVTPFLDPVLNFPVQGIRNDDQSLSPLVSIVSVVPYPLKCSGTVLKEYLPITSHTRHQLLGIHSCTTVASTRMYSSGQNKVNVCLACNDRATVIALERNGK